jgi:hypothetical protein
MEPSEKPLPTRTVKLQYKDYEEGEYISVMPRTAEATVQLINSYPWDEQRDHLAIGLTNPSVTIEGIDNDYLKLSPWYNGKFVLHYFDRERHLYTRSFDHLSGALPIISAYFGNEAPDLSTFKKEITWLQNNTAHFRTVEFIYSMKITKFFWLIALCLYLLAICAMCTVPVMLNHALILLLLIPLALLILLGWIIALAVNHYRSASGKLLILSRGKQEFSYGSYDLPMVFNKKDIREIITYGRTQKGGYPNLTRVEICFVDGRSIDISCLLIPQPALVGKFPHIPQSIVPTTFCFITPSYAVPS